MYYIELFIYKNVCNIKPRDIIVNLAFIKRFYIYLHLLISIPKIITVDNRDLLI